MRETAIASCEFVSLSRQPRSKKIKFTLVSGNLRKFPSDPSYAVSHVRCPARRSMMLVGALASIARPLHVWTVVWIVGQAHPLAPQAANGAESGLLKKETAATN